MLPPVVCEDPADLSEVEVLLVNSNEKQLSILLQVFNGFGARRVHSCATADQAMEIVAAATLGLIVSEIDLQGEGGFSPSAVMRRSEHEPNRRQPVILTRTARLSDVVKGRDCGATP